MVKHCQILAAVLLITGLLVARIILFVGNYAGIEHDSGWQLGLAKNLAHRGIYASYVNTIGEEGVGATGVSMVVFQFKTVRVFLTFQLG